MSILNIDLIATYSRQGDLRLMWIYHLVNALNISGWSRKDQLVSELSTRTGRSPQTVRRWIKLLHQKNLLKAIEGNVVHVSKYTLIRAYQCRSKSVRISLEELSDYNQFKRVVIGAVHKLLQGRNRKFYRFRRVRGMDNVSNAEPWRIPSKIHKVGSSTNQVSQKLGLSYKTVYDALRGQVERTLNLIGCYFLPEFKRTFEISFFIKNPWFFFRKDNKFIRVYCNLASVSLYSRSLFIPKFTGNIRSTVSSPDDLPRAGS